MVNAHEVIMFIEQSKKRFVEKLPYTTCPGDRITKVISNMGAFTKSRGQNKFSLNACFPDPDFPGVDDRLKHIQENCG